MGGGRSLLLVHPKGVNLMGVPESPIRTGYDLINWLNSQPREVYHRASALARSRGYGTRFVALDRHQVADLWHELALKPARGESPWGGNPRPPDALHR